jgi:sulfite exporter TauE/SafE
MPLAFYLSALTISRATLKMTVLQQISNPYLASLILGLLYGLTFCASACLPYIISYIAGIGAGFRKGVIITTIYNSGRIVAYALIGTAAGLLSAVISEEVFLSYQNYSSIAFAAVIVVIGVSILLKKSTACTCATKQPDPLGVSKLTQRFDIRAFFMGFTRGLILCPPLIALILYAVKFSQLDCTILAVLFGVGTALSPLMFLGGATGWLLNKAPLFRKWLSRIGGTVLVFMGVMFLLNALLAII